MSPPFPLLRQPRVPPALLERRGSASRQPGGFTLLEVLMAMAMMGIVAASLFASLGTAHKARESARSIMEPVQAVTVALELIGKDIECALPPTGILAGSFLGVPLAGTAGEADAMEFYRPAPLATATDLEGRVQGVQMIELSVETIQGEPLPVLVRRMSANLLAPVVEEPVAEILCRNVTGFDVYYFDGTIWQETWDSTTLDNILPSAVRISLQVAWPRYRSDEPTIYFATRTFLPSCRPTNVTGTTSTTGSTSSGSGASGGTQ
jgi:prepilin-type N-terminal cleavage/methylation domain-containing protein